MSTEAARAVEAILMVAQEPVDPHLLAQLLEIAPARVEELCAQLQAGYEEQERGFQLVKVAGGYRFQSHQDLTAYVERFALEGQSARLSSAALETLAIVAYKQPLSRAQVAAIRGVNVDGVMRTLQQRGYVVEVGRDSGPGQATLFGTSQEFLERLGLASLDDLPPIADLFPSADIMEALEKTLRADPIVPPAPADATPEGPTDDLAADGDPGADGPADEAPAVTSADGPADEAPAVTSEDELAEPVPPAWAVDPSPAAEPEAEPAPEGVDLDGDGSADLPPQA